MRKFCFVFLILFLTANSSLAWDEVGHKLSAYIAWENLKPEVREKVFKILNSAPEDSDLNTGYDQYNSRSTATKQRELFMFAAIWSDVIRDRKFDVRYKKYHQGDWHYADIFWKQENNKAVILENFPEESGKAIYKLSDFEKILRSSSYSDEEKAIALAWFLHVGGDIHQPLHNASRVTDTEKKGDQGGNLFKFMPPTKENSFGLDLHWYWDSIIARQIPRKNDTCDADYLSPIAKKMMKKYPLAKMQNRLNIGEYKAWNDEGFNFLNEYVYQGIERNQIPSKKYQQRAYNLGYEQLTLAGYRLAETLNRIFTQMPETTAEKKDINAQDAYKIWENVRSAMEKEENFKFIQVEIKGSTVTLKGIVKNVELKQKAVESIKNVEGVAEVVDLLEVEANA